MITSRQFYIILFLSSLCIKIQRLPCFLYERLGKDAYIFVLLYLVIDLLCISLAFCLIKIHNKTNFLEIKSKGANVILRLCYFVAGVFFLVESIMFYESIQDLFSHVLFDNLPWPLFSLLLLFSLFLLMYTGLKNIARNAELYFYLITFCLLALLIFGALKTDFTVVLPFQTINLRAQLKLIVPFNYWFSDFFLVLFLGFNTKDIKFKWTTIIYTISSLLVCLFMIEFFGIYKEYCSIEPSLMSVLSEQSMLGIDVGRVDWFFILISEIATIYSCGLCLFFAKDNISKCFQKFNSNYLILTICVLVYIMDILVLVDNDVKEKFFTNYASVPSMCIKIFVAIVISVFALRSWKTNKEKFNES